MPRVIRGNAAWNESIDGIVDGRLRVAFAEALESTRPNGIEGPGPGAIRVEDLVETDEYRFLIRYYSTRRMSLESIHGLGLAETHRITSDRARICGRRAAHHPRRLWVPIVVSGETSTELVFARDRPRGAR